MTTQTQKVIHAGGSGDYTTAAAWEAAKPANQVTADDFWDGLVRGTLTISSGTALTVAGSTSDATRHSRLRAEPGNGFRDNANIQTNALRANASNGAYIECSSSYALLLDVDDDFFEIVGLQLAATSAQTTGVNVNVGGSGTATFTMDWCIVEVVRAGAPVLNMFGSNCKVRNSLLVHRAASATIIAQMDSGASAYFTVFAVPSDKAAASFAIGRSYGTSQFTGCAFFNAATLVFGGGTTNYSGCFTDLGSPPSGVTQIAYDTSTGSGFQNISDGAHDFRIKTTSAMKDNSTTDATNGATDIAGSSRPQGAAYDGGCWEFVVAAAAGSFAMRPAFPMSILHH